MAYAATHVLEGAHGVAGPCIDPRAIKTVRRGGLLFSYVHEEEFSLLYADIFHDEVYRFRSGTPSPVILDCGAHIGLSVLYFKALYPDAEVIAFEPNPNTFGILQRNIEQNAVKGVTLVNAAIADAPGTVEFYVNRDPHFWSWGDAAIKNDWYNLNRWITIAVRATTLDSHLHRRVDFLKLDVEGLEAAVLRQAGEALSAVDQAVVEFHGSSTNPSNSFESVLASLTGHGLRVAVAQAKTFVSASRVRKDPYTLLMYADRNPVRFVRQYKVRPLVKQVRRKIHAIGSRLKGLNSGAVASA